LPPPSRHRTNRRRRPHSLSISSSFLVLDVTADDLDDIGVPSLLDEGSIAETLVLESDIIIRFGCLARDGVAPTDLSIRTPAKIRMPALRCIGARP